MIQNQLLEAALRKPRPTTDLDVLRMYADNGLGTEPSLEEMATVVQAHLRRGEVARALSMFTGNVIDTNALAPDSTLHKVVMKAPEEPELTFAYLVIQTAMQEEAAQLTQQQ
jgi:hypothetical protein